MAGAAAEACEAEETAGLNAPGFIDHAIAMPSRRDAPMRLTRCRELDLPARLQVI